MTALQALILGILQGLSEFLPISSSGHLVLLQKLFGITEGSMSFSILVHFGTLVSLCVVMRDRLLKYLREPLGRVPRMVVLGTVPTVIVVLAFGRIFNDFFETGASLGAGFIFTALVLLLAEKIGEKYGGGYIKKKQTGGWEEVGASGGGRQPIEKKVTLKLKCSYLFGDDEVHDIVTWWKPQKGTRNSLCYRIEFGGKEYTDIDHVKTDLYHSIATVVLDR